VIQWHQRGDQLIARNVDNALVAYDSEGLLEDRGDLCFCSLLAFADPGEFRVI